MMGTLGELERRRAWVLAELRRSEALLRERGDAAPAGRNPAAGYDSYDTQEYLRRFRARSHAPDRYSRDLRD